MAVAGRRTEGLRPLVIALATFGQLYHTLDRTHSSPAVRVSLPLAMWAAVVALWCLAMDAILLLELRGREHMLLLSLVSYSYVITSACYHVMTATRSGRLARLLDRLGVFDADLAGFGGRRPLVLADPLAAINVAAQISLGVSIMQVFTINSTYHWAQLVLVVGSTVVPTSFFKSSIILLSWNLRRALAASRTALPPSEKGNVAAGHRYGGLDLPRLQAACLQVGEAKEALLEYLGLPIGILTLGQSVILICTLCYWFRINMNPLLCFTSVVSLVSGMAVVCSSPQHLREEASEVEKELLLLNGPGDPDTHHQVCIILATLRRMSDMSVNGLYTLGSHNIVQVAGFVTTYLVILLQIPSHVMNEGANPRGESNATTTPTTGAANISF